MQNSQRSNQQDEQLVPQQQQQSAQRQLQNEQQQISILERQNAIQQQQQINERNTRDLAERHQRLIEELNQQERQLQQYNQQQQVFQNQVTDLMRRGVSVITNNGNISNAQPHQQLQEPQPAYLYNPSQMMAQMRILIDEYLGKFQYNFSEDLFKKIFFNNSMNEFQINFYFF